MPRVILHSDLNNFYASVECLYNPALRDKPVAVSGSPQLRHGIVLAKNELAKRHGVKTGEPLWMAEQKCREIVFVPPHYERYLRYSKLAKEIYVSYTDQVESFGLDECWLDVTGSAKLFGTGRHIADEIRARIKEELGVTASVGVSYNKIFAKLGSDMKKPDATTVISPQTFQQSVWPLPVSDLLYVGRATTQKLARYGIRTIGDLAQSPAPFLRQILGKNGQMLWAFANGMDTSPVANITAKPLIKSVGNSTTAPRDLVSDDDIKITLWLLCESVAARLREYDFVASTAALSVRDNTLNWFERQAPLKPASANARELFGITYALFCQNRPQRPVRSLGVRATGLSVMENIQLSLLPEEQGLQRQDALERAVDSLRNRFGSHAVQRAIMLKDPSLSHIDPKNDHIIHPVGFLRS